MSGTQTDRRTGGVGDCPGSKEEGGGGGLSLRCLPVPLRREEEGRRGERGGMIGERYSI